AAAGTRIRRPPAGPRCPRAGGPARCLPGAPAGRRRPSPGRSIRARRRRPRPASRTGPRAVRRAWRPGRARGWPRRPPGEWAVATCRAGVWRDAKCINPAATAPWPAVRGRLTGARGAAYRGSMEPTPDANARLRALAARIEALADRCQRLADENRSLRLQQEQL